MKYQFTYLFPIGEITIVATDTEIESVSFDASLDAIEIKETPLIQLAKEQLTEYFLNQRTTFDLPLHVEGTPFQVKVWEALQTIPYGETRTYLEIATQIGNPKAVRAVGNANHNNKIGIIIPCHRVIGKNGTLVGYAGGLDKKEMLLQHEKVGMK